MTTAALAVQLEQLRAIRILLEAAPDGKRHDDLIARAHVVAATVRKTRDALASKRLDSAKVST